MSPSLFLRRHPSFLCAELSALARKTIEEKTLQRAKARTSCFKSAGVPSALLLYSRRNFPSMVGLSISPSML